MGRAGMIRSAGEAPAVASQREWTIHKPCAGSIDNRRLSVRSCLRMARMGARYQAAAAAFSPS